MQVIVGPRQVGKSTLIGQVLEVCNMPYDSYSADDVVGVSADWLAGVWQTARMRMDIRGEGKRLLVVDEIQKINNWSETVKAEWDRDTREKRELIVVLLGSSRMLIEKGLTESLAGRYELIRLTHWTFPEMRECFGWNLYQYVYFGGYPGAASYITDERRWRNYVKDSLVEPSISKDVLMDTKIMKPQLLRQLFELGSSYSGELLMNVVFCVVYRNMPKTMLANTTQFLNFKSITTLCATCMLIRTSRKWLKILKLGGVM